MATDAPPSPGSDGGTETPFGLSMVQLARTEIAASLPACPPSTMFVDDALASSLLSTTPTSVSVYKSNLDRNVFCLRAGDGVFGAVHVTRKGVALCVSVPSAAWLPDLNPVSTVSVADAPDVQALLARVLAALMTASPSDREFDASLPVDAAQLSLDFRSLPRPECHTGGHLAFGRRFIREVMATVDGTA